MIKVENRQVVKKLCRLGNSLSFYIPVQFQEELDWHIGDMVSLQVIEGSLVCTKVTLPTVNVFRNREPIPPKEAA